MFSAGHLLWIAISFILIIGGLALCVRTRPDLDRMLATCLTVGIVSEIVKILSVAKILPVVEPVFHLEAGTPVLEYAAAGQYAPYIEMAHLPLELCSLQIVFIAAALWAKDPLWKRRFLSILYTTGVLGGLMGIVLAYVTVDYTTVQSYFSSPRIWQFFLYHAMVVTLGLYVGICSEAPFGFRDFRGIAAALVSMDMLSLYLNSVFSQAVYRAGKPVGMVYSVNFFSSYINPVGLVLTEKWQWITYLVIRAVLALGLVAALLLIQRRARIQRDRA